MVGQSGNTNLPILKCMSWQFLEFTLPLKISLDFNKSCKLLRDLFKYGNRKKTFTHVIVTYCFSLSRWKVFNGKTVISWVYKVFGCVKIIGLCKQIFSMVYPLEDKRDQMSKKMLCSCVCEKLTFLLHFLFISGLLEYPQCQQHDYNLILTFCYRSTYHHVCYSHENLHRDAYRAALQYQKILVHPLPLLKLFNRPISQQLYVLGTC